MVPTQFADDPQGPFIHVESIDEPLSCDRSECNTYFASWVPWTDSEGNHIWSIGHNRWNGSETLSHLTDYRPTFLTISIREAVGKIRRLCTPLVLRDVGASLC